MGESPLGPFTYAPNSPFSSRPSGFIAGAGHGSTIEDKYGNLWHVSTMCISVNQDFERRVGLFPAKLDKDGLLYCRQDFADYPVVVPEGRFDADEIVPRYMLLSYRKPVRASSSLEGHLAELAVDESIRTWWCASGCAGEWLEVDLGKEYAPHSIQLNFADEGVPVKEFPGELHAAPGPGGERYIDSGKNLRTRYLLEGSLDGKSWFALDDQSQAETDLPHPYILLPEGTRLRYVRLTGVERPYGSRLAMSGLRVFGLGDGEKPAPVKRGQTVMEDAMTCRISWEPSEDADGYNVRFGIAPDKLYSSYQVYGASQVRLTTLNADQQYYFAIDPFNENGITGGKIHKIIK